MTDSKNQRLTRDTDHSTTTEIDATTATQAIATQATKIKQEELQYAYNRLASDTSVSPSEKAVLDAMATAIVEDIIAAPIGVLENTAAYDDKAVETAVELFDPAE